MTEYRFKFDPAMERELNPFIGDPVESKEIAENQLYAIAGYTLHLHEISLMPDYSNYGFIEKREDGGEWEEMGEYENY